MAHAATTTTLARNLALPAGTSIFPAATGGVAVNLGPLVLSADVSNVAPTTTITVEMDATTDGGSTWRLVANFTFPGGTYTNRQGVTTGVHNMATDWQQIPQNADGTGPLVTPNGRVTVTMSAPGTVSDVTLTN